MGLTSFLTGGAGFGAAGRGVGLPAGGGVPPGSGDAAAFCDAGAYGFSMASHYNARLLPPEVLVDGDSIRIIRERQTLDDLLRGQR